LFKNCGDHWGNRTRTNLLKKRYDVIIFLQFKKEEVIIEIYQIAKNSGIESKDFQPEPEKEEYDSI